MALLYLVRHGQASFGSEDYDRLSDLGRRQSRWLGEYFAERGLAFRRVVSGTLRRQTETTKEILAGMACAPSFDTHAGLDEYDGVALYAAYTGGADQRAHQRGDRKDYWRAFRAAHEAWSGGRLPGMRESWSDFGARIRAGLESACEGAARSDVILAVTSGGVIGAALAQLLDAPGRTAIELNLQLRNAAFCELVVGRGTLRLVSFNCIPHLDVAARRTAITLT